MECDKTDKGYKVSDSFDNIYDTAKKALFTSENKSDTEKTKREALDKIRAIIQVNGCNKEYLEDLKTVIEFDDHSLKGAYAQDRKKSLDILDQGYKVICVRERTKKISKKLDYHEIFWDNNYTSVYPENVDSEVLEEIKTLVLTPNNI